MIYKEMQNMDKSNYMSMESYYAKKGPYLMRISVKGKYSDITEATPVKCIVRATNKHGSEWKEVMLQTTNEFFEKVKAL